MPTRPSTLNPSPPPSSPPVRPPRPPVTPERVSPRPPVRPANGLESTSVPRRFAEYKETGASVLGAARSRETSYPPPSPPSRPSRGPPTPPPPPVSPLRSPAIVVIKRKVPEVDVPVMGVADHKSHLTGEGIQMLEVSGLSSTLPLSRAATF